MHEEQKVREGEPGFGREEELEAATPAAAEDPITVSPDPDAEDQA